MLKALQRLRVVPLLAYERAIPRLSVTVGSRRIDVSTPAWFARSLAYWRPSWKTQLIGHYLARREGLFIDVGANIGQTLLDYISCSPTGGYRGFEPSLDSASNVSRLIKKNRLENCQILPVALSDSTGLTTLFERHVGDSCATMVEDLRPSFQNDARAIATLELDNLDLSPIAVIKIDVEGAELAVLEGMRRTLRSGSIPVVCEILRRDSRSPAKEYEQRISSLEALLRDIGYVALLIEKTSDLSKVAALKPVEAFPLEPFTNTTRELNDYLLCPADSIPILP